MAWRSPEERAKDAVQAKKYRKAGLTLHQISALMGFAPNTISDMINYPEKGELYRHQRKRNVNRYTKVCPKCGGKMSHDSTQCWDCRIASQPPRAVTEADPKLVIEDGPEIV